MIKSLNHTYLVLLTGLFLTSLWGCQAFNPKSPGELALENHDFISLWDTYNQCVAGSNIHEMHASLKLLHMAPRPISIDDSPIPLPKFLKKLTSSRNSRLAVDPRAMAASCSIHLAEVAQRSSDWITARETLQSIVENYPEPQYAFYVSQANQALEQFSSIRPVSLSFGDTFVH